MFMGTFYNSIDAKNRMIVPAKHREQLGEKCIVTCGLDKCLYIYTEAEWEKQVEKIERLPESDSQVRAFIRHMYSNATTCTFDKQGRIVLTANLLDYAGITKELVTMGVMKKIEIWAKEVWDNPGNQEKMDAAQFADALSEYNF